MPEGGWRIQRDLGHEGRRDECDVHDDDSDHRATVERLRRREYGGEIVRVFVFVRVVVHMGLGGDRVVRFEVAMDDLGVVAVIVLIVDVLRRQERQAQKAQQRNECRRVTRGPVAFHPVGLSVDVTGLVNRRGFLLRARAVPAPTPQARTKLLCPHERGLHVRQDVLGPNVLHEIGLVQKGRGLLPGPA